MNSLKYLIPGNIRWILTNVMVVVLLMSCAKDYDDIKDLIKPTAQIELVNSNGRFLAGSSIVINGSFSDNEALKACEITINSNRNLKGFDVDWDYDEDKIELSGKEDFVEMRQVLPVIPVDIYYGEYILSFKVIDQANNFSEYKFDIVIE